MKKVSPAKTAVPESFPRLKKATVVGKQFFKNGNQPLDWTRLDLLASTLRNGVYSCIKMSKKTVAKVNNRWLFKEEPDHYSIGNLEAEGATLWDGVDNNLARRNLRKVEPGDAVLYYHTGKERAIVGEMRVLEGPMPDPASKDPKAVVVKVAFVRRWPRAVSLEMIKKEPRLVQWELVRLPRLSIVPVSQAQWGILEQLARQDGT